MLNIEVIKFEAQDVITASTAAPDTIVVPECSNASGHTIDFVFENGKMVGKCRFCGKEVEANPGDTIVGG